MARPFEFSQVTKDQARLRQDGICAVCGDPLDDSEEHAHHVAPNQSGDAQDPAHAWIRGVDNCVVLCDLCHAVVHDDGKYQNGAVAPPSYFRYSHGNRRGEHLDWVKELSMRIAEWLGSIALATMNNYRIDLQNRLSFSSGDHRGQKDLVDNSFAGFMTNALFNGPCPELIIWNPTWARLAAAERALHHGNVKEAYKDLVYANRAYVVALHQYLNWKHGIEGAGNSAILAISLTAIAVPVAIWAGAAVAGAIGIEAAGAGAAAVAGADASAATEQLVVRIAQTCERANTVFRVIDVAVAAGDAADAEILEMEMQELEYVWSQTLGRL